MVSRHQIKQAIEILELAFAEDFHEYKQEIETTLKKVKKEINATNHAMSLLSEDAGKAQATFGFDEEWFRTRTLEQGYVVEKYINKWMISQSDWRLPMVIMAPTDPSNCHLGVKSMLVYVLTNSFDQKYLVDWVQKKLQRTDLAVPTMFRQKKLVHTGKINEFDVPYGQIGNIISTDYFPYLSLEQIRNYLKHIALILRPGGQAIIHASDAETEDEFKEVVDKKRCWCTIDIFKQMTIDAGLDYRYHVHVDKGYTFYHIQKPGTISSVKVFPTRMEPV